MKVESTIESRVVRETNRVPRFVMPLVKTLIFATDAWLAAGCFMLAFVWREQQPIFANNDWQFSG